MASLKALFSVFSQTASLQFAKGGGRGDNFKTFSPTSQLSDQSWQMGNMFVSVGSCGCFGVQSAKVYKARNVLVCKCVHVQARECVSMYIYICASTF